MTIDARSEPGRPLVEMLAAALLTLLLGEGLWVLGNSAVGSLARWSNVRAVGAMTIFFVEAFGPLVAGVIGLVIARIVAVRRLGMRRWFGLAVVGWALASELVIGSASAPLLIAAAPFLGALSAPPRGASRRSLTAMGCICVAVVIVAAVAGALLARSVR